jgi:hypothetical protein
MCFSLSCRANARVKLAKTGHGQHSSKFVVYVVLFVIRIVLLLIVLFCVLFVCKCVLPPGVNPIAVDKYIISNFKKISSPGLKWLYPTLSSFSSDRTFISDMSNSDNRAESPSYGKDWEPGGS